MKQLPVDLIKALDAIREGIYVLDQNLNTLYVNKAYEKITGLSYSLLSTKTAYDIHSEGLTSNAVSPLVLEKRAPVSLIQTFSTGKTALLTGTPVFDENRKLVNVVITVSDVTEQNNLYEKLIRQKVLTETTEDDIKKIAASLIVYKSPLMEKIVSFSTRLAKTDSPVLITGETGVGKELIAKLIFQTSLRSKNPFVVINCAAIPANLAESELFGYVDGAFTGAKKGGYAGIFERAHTGTVFLDEIGELPLELQSKLLRTLQEYTVARIGGNKSIKVDFRVIAATNRNLTEMVSQGTFRSDLYYRLNVINVNIPPLRMRNEDILPLIELKMKKLNARYSINKSFSSLALEYLQQYPWPGNVRELHNTIERIFLCTEENTLTVADIINFSHSPSLGTDPLNIHASTKKQSCFTPKTPSVALNSNQSQVLAAEDTKQGSLKLKVVEYEKTLIFESFSKSKSMKEAAKILDIDPSTLTRKCQQYGIKPDF